MARERAAVIGGGIAGLACAHRLQEAGWGVDVFEKARKPGGRMSTRRAGEFTFDHGTPFFTARDPFFRRVVERWEREGAVAAWRDAIVTFDAEGRRASRQPSRELRYVGLPTMSSIPRIMSEGLEVHAHTRITEVSRVRSGFILGDTEATTRRPYDWVIVATPAQQAVNLLASNRQLAAAAERAAMAPCLTAMVGFGERLPVEFAGAFVERSPLCWLGRQSSKPGRPEAEAWVIHADAKFSRARLADAPEEIAHELLAEMGKLLDLELPPPLHLSGHRWRYAKTGQPLPEGFLLDAELGLGACGDWCMGPRVEDAWRSGDALARQLVATVAAR